MVKHRTQDDGYFSNIYGQALSLKIDKLNNCLNVLITSTPQSLFKQYGFTIILVGFCLFLHIIFGVNMYIYLFSLLLLVICVLNSIFSIREGTCVNIGIIHFVIRYVFRKNHAGERIWIPNMPEKLTKRKYNFYSV